MNELKKIIFLGALLAVTSVAFAAWQEPASTAPAGNLPAPLNTLPCWGSGCVTPGDQWRANPLALGKTSAPITNYAFDVEGLIQSTGLSIFGDLYTEGSFKSDTLKSTSGQQKLCANASGEMVTCGTYTTAQTVFIDSTPDGTEQFVVPQGVTEMTVEIHGAGGGGFYYQNTSVAYDPRTSTDCTSESFVLHGKKTTFSGPGVSLEAKGGQCGYKVASYTGGAGGVASGSGSAIKSGTLVTVNGEAGTPGSNPSNFVIKSAPTSCTDFVLGGKGGDGGKGGGSGPYGGITPMGGTYKTSGLDLAKCFGVGQGLNGVNGSYGPNGQQPADYPPDVPISPYPGVGGGGAPGQAGASAIQIYATNDCPNNLYYPCNGSRGYPGGGGGGYVKATISVTGGDIFYYDVGAAYQTTGGYSIPGGRGFVSCSTDPTIWKVVQNCGSLSGYGAHGQVKITY